MLRSIIVLLSGLCLAAPAAAQDAPAPATTRVAIETSEGTMIVAVETSRAPITARNFLRYVDEKRFDGTAFYRAMTVAPGFGLIQGGTRGEPARTRAAIAHEPTTQTGLSHDEGTISMARYEPGSAAGDFFITVGAMNGLDANPAATGDNAGFAAFGHIVEGMDVVRKILAAPTSATEGEEVMRGQMIAAPIRISKVHRLP